MDELTRTVDQPTRNRVLDEARLCTLDPERPAPSLLDDLHAAIFGCFKLWRTEVLVEDTFLGDDGVAGDNERTDHDLDDLDPDDDPRLHGAFAAEVAAVAARTDRMSL